MISIRIPRFFNGLKPLEHLNHPGEMIRQFTPNWFAVTMGTGILALILPQTPGAGPLLYAAGRLLWLCNIFLFTLFLMLYGSRWILFRHEAQRIFNHSVVSMFLGTIPMGLATIINGFLVYGLPRWGETAVAVAQTLWWADTAMSLGCGVIIPYCMFTRHDHKLEQMTGVWLLPVVAAEVAAVSGGLLAPHLADAQARFATLIAGYVLWAYSVPVAFSIQVILLLRMALHKLPQEGMAATSWLALGPIGTGALGLLVLGGDIPTILSEHGLADAGAAVGGVSMIAGAILWGFGLWWLFLATLITIRYFRSEVPFNLGWWGYIFPLGVYTMATLKLGQVFSLGFFSVFGGFLSAALAVIWCLVAVRTVRGGWRGDLFISPCISSKVTKPPLRGEGLRRLS